MLGLGLSHGRRAIDEALDDWGFEGPTIRPLIATCCTSNHATRRIHPSDDNTERSKSRTGWSSQGTDSLIVTVKSDMIRVTLTGLSAWFVKWDHRPATAEHVALSWVLQHDVWWHAHILSLSPPDTHDAPHPRVRHQSL